MNIFLHSYVISLIILLNDVCGLPPGKDGSQANLVTDMKLLKMEMKKMETDMNELRQNFTSELQRVNTIIDVDDCENVPCQNGGHCINLEGINRFKCICKRSYRGSRCQFCAHGFKKRGGICIFHQNSFSHRLRSFGNSYYVIGKEKKPWPEARETCQNIGGDLASCETIEEWDQLFEELKKSDKLNMHWLGGSGNANGWKWITGIAIDTSSMGVGPWRSGQPNTVIIDGATNKACLVSNWPKYSGSSWNWWDNKCSFRARFVCEFKRRY